MTIQEQLGDALYQSHGAYCEELLRHGYELDDFYNGSGGAWGDFRKMFCLLAVVRGAKSYDDYVTIFNAVKTDDDELATKQMFARTTGIKSIDKTQAERTRRYRQNASAELRELRAKAWIDDNLDQAKTYIESKV